MIIDFLKGSTAPHMSDIEKIDAFLQSDLFLKGLGVEATAVTIPEGFSVISAIEEAVEMMCSQEAYSLPHPWPFDYFPGVQSEVRRHLNSYTAWLANSPEWQIYRIYDQNQSEIDTHIHEIVFQAFDRHQIEKCHPQPEIEDCKYEIATYILYIVESVWYFGLTGSKLYHRMYQAFLTGGTPCGWVGAPIEDGGNPDRCIQLLHFGVKSLSENPVLPPVSPQVSKPEKLIDFFDFEDSAKRADLEKLDQLLNHPVFLQAIGKDSAELARPDRFSVTTDIHIAASGISEDQSFFDEFDRLKQEYLQDPVLLEKVNDLYDLAYIGMGQYFHQKMQAAFKQHQLDTIFPEADLKEIYHYTISYLYFMVTGILYAGMDNTPMIRALYHGYLTGGLPCKWCDDNVNPQDPANPIEAVRLLHFGTKRE